MNLLIITGKKLLYFILFFTIIMETLISEFNFPSFIRYFNDIALIFLLFLMRGKIINSFKKKHAQILLLCILLFFIISLLSSLINFVSFPLVIWGIRNTFRGILYFIATVVFLEKEDIPKLFNKLLFLQVISLLLALYQFFVLNHDMDSVGGIFGYGNGAGVNVFNSLLIAYYLNAFLYRKEKIFKLVLVLFSSFIIAAISEEKITYLFFVIVFLISILFSKFSVKKVLAIFICSAGLLFGLNLMKSYYPDMYNVLIEPDMLIEYSQRTYDEGYMIPRIGAFSFISNYFFHSSKDFLLGFGLGNCDTSNYSIFQSTFYNKYGHFNYRWFTHQWLFLEEGYIGFISFLMIFILILYCLFRLRKRFCKNHYVITSICMTICCIILIWYNSTLKNDMSYLAYFSMAIGFASLNTKQKEMEVKK